MASAEGFFGSFAAAMAGADTTHLRKALVKGVTNTALRGANGFARMLGQEDQLMRIPLEVPSPELSPLQPHVSVPSTVFFEATKASIFESGTQASPTVPSTQSLVSISAPELWSPSLPALPGFWFAILAFIILALGFSLARLNSEAKQFEQDKSSAQQKHNELERRVKELEGDRSTAEQKHGELEGQVKTLEGAKLTAERRNGDLESQVKTLEEENSAAQKKNRELECEVKMLDGDKSSAEQKHAELDGKIKELDGEKTSAEQERDKSKQKVGELERAQSSAEEKAQDFEKEVGELKEANSTALQEHREFEKTIAQLKREKSEADDKIATLNQEIVNLGGISDGLRKAKATLEKKIEALQAETTDTKTEVMALTAAKQTLEDEVKRYNARDYSSKATHKYLEWLVSKHQAKALKASRDMEDAMKGKQKQLEQEKLDAKCRIAVLVAECNRLEQQLHQQAQDFVTVTKDHQLMFNQRAAVRAENKGLIGIVKLMKQHSDKLGNAGTGLLATDEVSQDHDWEAIVESQTTALRSAIEQQLAQQCPEIQGLLHCLVQLAMNSPRYGFLYERNRRRLNSTQGQLNMARDRLAMLEGNPADAQQYMSIWQMQIGHRDSSIQELTNQNQKLQDSLAKIQQSQTRLFHNYQNSEARLAAKRKQNDYLKGELQSLTSNNQRLENDNTKLEASEKSLENTVLTLREQISGLMGELRVYDPTASATRPSVTGEHGRRRRAMSFPQAKPEVVGLEWLRHIFGIINEAVSAHRTHSKTLLDHRRPNGYYRAEQWKSDEVQTISKEATNNLIDTLGSKLMGTEPELCKLIKDWAHELMQRVTFETMYKVKQLGGKTGLKTTNGLLAGALKKLYEAHCRGPQDVTDYLRSDDWQKVVWDQQALKGDKLNDALDWSLEVGADAAGTEATITADGQEAPAENETAPALHDETPAEHAEPLVEQDEKPDGHDEFSAEHQTPAEREAPAEHDEKLVEHGEMPDEQQTPAEHETPAEGEQLPTQREEKPAEHEPPAQQEEPSPAHKVPTGDKKGKKPAVGMTGSIWAGIENEPPANAPRQPKSWNRQNGPKKGQWSSWRK